YAGNTYYFCSNGCMKKFATDPAKYLAPKPSKVPTAPLHHDGIGGLTQTTPASMIYTCPMHPQVRSSAPGPCPICGMALEPLIDPSVSPSASMGRPGGMEYLCPM